MSRLQARLITAEDVLRCGSPYRDCELWDGAAVVCSPSGGTAEIVAARAVGPLFAHAGTRSGWVFLSSQGFLLARNPDRMLAPDGAWLSRDRLPKPPERGFIEMAPDFLIEVRSPDDSWEAVVEKCGVWIAHGAGCAWAIDPSTHTVAEFRPGQAPVVRRDPGAVARAEPVLPDFALPIADLFLDL